MPKRRRTSNENSFLDAVPHLSVGLFAARRLPEFKSLWAQVQPRLVDANQATEINLLSNGRKTSLRHLRRRTTSHLSRKRHRYPNRETAPDVTSTNRKARRKRSTLRKQHSEWNNPSPPQVVRWIPSHLWHIKRFHMVEMFGWKIPLQHANRGCVAAERLLVKEQRTLIQDITWRMQPIVLCTDDIEATATELSRICPKFSADCQNTMAEGLLFERDQYPMGAIGPVLWWIRSMAHSAPASAAARTHEVNLYCHPCTRNRVLATLSLSSLWTILTPPWKIACFQLRGTYATDVLAEVLKINHTQLRKQQPHLSVTIANVGIEQQTSLHPDCMRPYGLEDKQVVLMRRTPDGAATCFHGWDIHCSIDDAHDIFMNFANHGRAAVIGMVEDLYVKLQRNLHVFPLCYPDSRDGNMYWESTSPDWRILRASMDSCGGRLNLKNQKFQTNFYRCLQECSATKKQHDSIAAGDTKGIHPVVVRGGFMHPFLELVKRCVHMPRVPASTKNADNKRRLRRRLTPDSVIRLAPLLSRQESHHRRSAADISLRSLSLSAIIRCVVTVRGKGTLQIGDAIHSCFVESGCAMKTEEQLGVVAAGSFVGSIGMFRGSGYVGASKLLSFLSSTKHPAIMIVGDQVHLVVEISRAIKDERKKPWKATISLVT